MKQHSPPNRLENNETGIGEISESDVAERARRLAIADGRHEANDADFERARVDLTQPESLNDEQGDRLDEADRPDAGVPPSSLAKRSPRVELEDEGSLAAEEVEEGIAEADLDTRVRSRH